MKILTWGNKNMYYFILYYFGAFNKVMSLNLFQYIMTLYSINIKIIKRQVIIIMFDILNVYTK